VFLRNFSFIAGSMGGDPAVSLAAGRITAASLETV
jgi:hypothetical protein